jgi:electron transfer flavoprotein alpha subunit
MKVWVWADVTPEGPATSALELLTKARDLGDEVAGVALGPGAKASADALGDHGAQTLYATTRSSRTTSRSRPCTRSPAWSRSIGPT